MSNNIKHSIHEVIIVEGRYDKGTVLQAVDATVMETSGFRIFSDKETTALFSRLAKERGLVILTDSDSAGFFIRDRLRGILSDVNIKHAYIPDIEGKERRKASSSKEGKLGVEGMSADIIITALKRAGATFSNSEKAQALPREPVTISDLYSLGLTGSTESARNRRALLQKLALPSRLSTKKLLDVLNILYSREEFLDFMNG